MGTCSSVDNSINKHRQKEIEDRLNNAYSEEEKVVKCLLLGAGECGKSTILKQMKILHNNGFSEQELKQGRELTYRNSLESIQTLCRACLDLAIQFDSGNSDTAEIILDIDRMDGVFHLSLKDHISRMWKDSGVQKAMQRANEFNLLDSASYFLSQENLDRVFMEDYVPTEQDILRCRIATTGIIQNEFRLDKNNKLKMFDVGGQRGERKKWIHSFDNVQVIMFIASLAEYDLVLAEDRTRNRLKESLDLFEGIINLPWFKEAPIILFLNKEDLFKIKVETVDIGIYHPTYSGGCDYNNGLQFIRESYFNRNCVTHKTIYCHVTDATNTEMYRFVWKTTRHIILEKNLTDSGLLMC